MTEFHPVQERDAVPGFRLGGIALFGVATTVVAVVASAALAGMFHQKAPPKAPPARAPAEFGIVEQTLIDHTERGITLRAEQHAALAHYSWVDRDRGLVRIPIERAIELTAEKPR